MNEFIVNYEWKNFSMLKFHKKNSLKMKKVKFIFDITNFT